VGDRQALLPWAGEPEPPRARRADPASSHLAAAEMERRGVIARQAGEVVAAVRRWQGRTSAELARLLGADRHAVARRLPELARGDRPAVVRGALRRCAVTQRACLTWWASDERE